MIIFSADDSFVDDNQSYSCEKMEGKIFLNSQTNPQEGMHVNVQILTDDESFSLLSGVIVRILENYLVARCLFKKSSTETSNYFKYNVIYEISLSFNPEFDTDKWRVTDVNELADCNIGNFAKRYQITV